MDVGPRVSFACFFGPDDRSERVYSLIINSFNRSVTVPEFLGYNQNKGLDGRSARDHF
jgi:hypothetical protein